MKHSSSENLDLLREQASMLGVDLDQEQAARLLKHLDLVLLQNRTVNLTRIIDRQEAVRLHIVDSVALLPYLEALSEPEGSIRQVADLGTGAGFPGIPLALLTSDKVTLVESIQKKAAALANFASSLDLNNQVHVYAGRAEELAVERANSFDIVTARALSSLPSLLELAAPLLRHNGYLLAMKGQTQSDEKERAESIEEMLGMKIFEHHSFVLPKGNEHRELFIYKKISEPKLVLPRKMGKAQKTPLRAK